MGYSHQLRLGSGGDEALQGGCVNVMVRGVRAHLDDDTATLPHLHTVTTTTNSLHSILAFTMFIIHIAPRTIERTTALASDHDQDLVTRNHESLQLRIDQLAKVEVTGCLVAACSLQEAPSVQRSPAIMETKVGWVEVLHDRRPIA